MGAPATRFSGTCPCREGRDPARSASVKPPCRRSPLTSPRLGSLLLLGGIGSLGWLARRWAAGVSLTAADGHGSEALDQIVDRLRDTRIRSGVFTNTALAGPQARIPARGVPLRDSFKVRGVASSGVCGGAAAGGRLHWQGDSDALITKGLAALLDDRARGPSRPRRSAASDPSFLTDTGLHGQPHPLAGQRLPQHPQDDASQAAALQHG